MLMEHQHLVAVVGQHAAGAVDAGRRIAEHRRGNQRPLLPGDRRLGAEHAGDGARRVGVHRGADAVDAGHVDDRRHHDDVLRPDDRPHVARGNRGDHHLGHAEGQGAHSRRGDRRAATAARAQDRIQPKSMTAVASPCCSMRSLTKANSRPFVSRAPTMTTLFTLGRPAAVI